jgi:spore maturation protein SpmA
MLNWIWMGLIVIAIAVATGRDITESSNDRFRNGKELSFHPISVKQISPDHFSINAFITKKEFASFYPSDEAVKEDTIAANFDCVTSTKSLLLLTGTGTLNLPDNAPAVWQDMANFLSDGKKINGKLRFSSDDSVSLASFVPDEVRFRILNKLVNDGIVKTAETAVTLAIGLIGIMAFWLGLMKIAEAAGLVTLLAKIAKPIMVRLFPEVPAEHPAMGAMLSNMAANFLGLSNAATPLGLKAMEELNKLNPVTGTATNAMCMFLTINTSAITLIPATVIAVRASLGSHEPTDIILPTFLATLLALTCGVIFNRFIQRFFPVKQ